MSVEIKCSFSYKACSYTDFDVFPTKPGTSRDLYTCEVTSASITMPGTRVTSFKGKHQPYNNLNRNHVKAIYFTDTVVNYFPLGLGGFFPNLKHLKIENCGLKEISRRDLIGLEKLTSLCLNGNELQSLPDNLLSGMANLTVVDFNFNKLKLLSSELLRPIMKIKLEMVDVGSSSMQVQFTPGPHTIESVQRFCDHIDSSFEKPIIKRKEKIAKGYPDRLCRGFKDMWISGLFSDFTVVCDSKEFKVHKSVLAIQSPVLAAALKSDMEESKTGRMEIKDFSEEAVKDFLKYFYTEETPEATNAMEMLALASKYDVNELKTLMEEIVRDNIDDTNALEILVFGKQHNCQMLVQEAFKQIQLMFADSKKEIDPKLIDDIEKLKQLIDAKHHYESLLESCFKVPE